MTCWVSSPRVSDSLSLGFGLWIDTSNKLQWSEAPVHSCPYPYLCRQGTDRWEARQCRLTVTSQQSGLVTVWWVCGLIKINQTLTQHCLQTVANFPICLPSTQISPWRKNWLWNQAKCKNLTPVNSRRWPESPCCVVHVSETQRYF